MREEAEGDPVDEGRRCEGGSAQGGPCDQHPLVGSRWCKQHEIEAVRPQWNAFQAALAAQLKRRDPPAST